MPMRVTCVCGRQLALGAEHVGRPAACPACGHPFVPDRRATDLRQGLRPAPPLSLQRPVEPEESAPAAPGLEPAPRPPELGRPLTTVGHDFLVGVAWLLNNPAGYWLAVAACLLGVVTAGIGATLVMSYYSYLKKGQNPVALTLAELEAGGAGPGDHVCIRDFIDAATLRYDEESKTWYWNYERYWRHFPPGGYLPLFPHLEGGKTRRGAGEPVRLAREPTSVLVAVRGRDLVYLDDHDHWRVRELLCGVLTRGDEVLDGDTQRDLRKAYPDTNLPAVLVLVRKEEQEPDPSLASSLIFFGALAATGAGLLLAVHRHARRTGLLRPTPAPG